MREVWPRMPVVLSWTGASAAAQLPLLEPFLGGVRARDNPYICTEAAITVPVYDGAEAIRSTRARRSWPSRHCSPSGPIRATSR